MKYYSTLPLTALIVIIGLSVLIEYSIVPSGSELLTMLRNADTMPIYWLLFLIILLEAIIYIGFYFPGQFFAVIIVVIGESTLGSIINLTLIMVAAATLASLINYSLGRYLVANRQANSIKSESSNSIEWRKLLPAMIHINALAFFMFNHGSKKGSRKILWASGLINLPYYLLLVVATSLLSEQVMKIAESPFLIVALVSLWLGVAMFFDWRKYRAS